MFEAKTDTGETVKIVEKGMRGEQVVLRSNDGRTFIHSVGKTNILTQLPEEAAAMRAFIGGGLDLNALDDVVAEGKDVLAAGQGVIDEATQGAAAVIEKAGELAAVAGEEAGDVVDAAQTFADEAQDVVDAVQDVFDGTEEEPVEEGSSDGETPPAPEAPEAA